MSSRHETPEEFDDSLEREEISPSEYYKRVGFIYDGSYRVGFWREYWRHPEDGIPALPPAEWQFDIDSRGAVHYRDLKTGRFIKHP